MQSEDSHHCEACEAAIRELQKIVATSEGIDRARALIQLGDAAVIGFRMELALASFGACLDLVGGGKHPDLVSGALFKESCVLAAMGRFDEALDRIGRAKEICRRQDDLDHLALCEWREGAYYADVGRTQEAIELITRARDRYLDLDLPAMARLAELELQATDEARRPGPKRRTGKRRPRRRS